MRARRLSSVTILQSSRPDRDSEDRGELGSFTYPALAFSDEVKPSRASGECRPDSDEIGSHLFAVSRMPAVSMTRLVWSERQAAS